MYVDDRLGRRSRARSGLDQLDLAEDLFAEVAAAVAVVVPHFVVHVLDHGRGADRRITINRVGRRRVRDQYLFQVVSFGGAAVFPVAAVPSFRELRLATRCEGTLRLAGIKIALFMWPWKGWPRGTFFGRQSIRVSKFLARTKPPRGLLYTIP